MYTHRTNHSQKDASRRDTVTHSADLANRAHAGTTLKKTRRQSSRLRRGLLALAGVAASYMYAPLPIAASDSRTPVVASFSILADLTREVGGDRVSVTSLVGPGGDVHVFSPAPADAARIANARLLVTNGLALEGWLPRLMSASGAKAPIVVASKGINAAHMDETASAHDHTGEDHASHDHGTHDHGTHDHGNLDPHAWQDVANVKAYVRNIRDGLIAVDPDGRASYETNADAFLARLDTLDAELRRRMSAIPAERRRIVTTHDAFGYFGRAYGLQLTAPQGRSTEAEASAADVARVIREIRATKAPAVFVENISDPRLMQRIGKETGAIVGGRLYTDSLSPPDGPAPTYIHMMRRNMETLEKALQPR